MGRSKQMPFFERGSRGPESAGVVGCTCRAFFGEWRVSNRENASLVGGRDPQAFLSATLAAPSSRQQCADLLRGGAREQIYALSAESFCQHRCSGQRSMGVLTFP